MEIRNLMAEILGLKNVISTATVHSQRLQELAQAATQDAVKATTQDVTKDAHEDAAQETSKKTPQFLFLMV